MEPESSVNEATAQFEETEVAIEARDGFVLAGQLLLPKSPKVACLLSPATGITKEFYLNFARFAAARGVACLVFDFRGTGQSVPKDLLSFKGDYSDWGRLDMVAALDLLIDRVGGNVPIVHVGNSVGGHMIGFMSNHEKMSRHVFVSVGLGTWWTHQFPRQQALDLFFWWVYGPFSILRHGYVPAGGLWGGSTLPKSVFRTWRRWSHKRNYFREELDGRLQPHWFNEIRAPIAAIVFTDDPITNPETTRRFLAFMPNASASIRVLSPADLGVKRLDHQDIYRRRNAKAWPTILEAVLDGV